jgi:hypothetical protein
MGESKLTLYRIPSWELMLNTNSAVNPYFTVGVFALAPAFCDTFFADNVRVFVILDFCPTVTTL